MRNATSIKYTSTISASVGTKNSGGLEGTSGDQVELFEAGPITGGIQHLSQLSQMCPRMEFLQHFQVPAPIVDCYHV